MSFGKKLCTAEGKTVSANRKRTIIMIFLPTAVFAFVYLFLYNPAEKNNYYPPCLFLYLTGYYCPGCGSLRAAHQLLHGRLLGAFDLNPLLVLSLPLVTYLVLAEFNALTGWKVIFPRVSFRPFFYKLLIAIVVLYWILRNIPAYPFSLLAP
jgi:hypothetical protein